MTTSIFLDPAGPRLKAIFLLATLKHKRGGGEFSHTETLAGVVIENLREYKVQCEVVRLVDYDIKAGTKSNMGPGDEWPGILKKILDSDIIIFATPVWWGIQSSLMQRVIERLDELHEELRETGKSRLTNKVGGIVITGEEDGEQHITGTSLTSCCQWACHSHRYVPSPTRMSTREPRRTRSARNSAKTRTPLARRRRWRGTSCSLPDC